MGQPWPLLLLIFGIFKQTLQFLQQIYVKNIHPVYGARIRTHDHEPPPVTTRPGLLPELLFIFVLLTAKLIAMI